jgi:hypothetical protein
MLHDNIFKMTMPFLPVKIFVILTEISFPHIIPAADEIVPQISQGLSLLRLYQIIIYNHSVTSDLMLHKLTSSQSYK